MVNIQTDFEKLLEELDLDGSRLIIMVDEFTETIDNILLKHGQVGSPSILATFSGIKS